MSSLPSGTWRIEIRDGAGNGYVVDGRGDDATLHYRPVTPAESSSGVYSGGEPATRALERGEAQTAWAMATALEGDVAHHVAQRQMGTVAQQRSAGDGDAAQAKHSVIVDAARGAEVVRWYRDRLGLHAP